MATHSAGKYLEALKNLNNYFPFFKVIFLIVTKPPFFVSSTLNPFLLWQEKGKEGCQGTHS